VEEEKMTASDPVLDRRIYRICRTAMPLLVEIGRQEGLERIFGYILPDNYSLLRIAKKVGFTVTFDRLETVMWAKLELK
jgi:hypothetical protein